MHIHHATPDVVRAWLSLEDVDHLLTASGIRAPAVRLVKNGDILPESVYTQHATLAGRAVTGLVDPRKVLDLLDEGATVVLQGLQRYWPPLTGLVSSLESELGHPCQANAYLTPAGAQGFAEHADTHDVLVVQTHGSKHWCIREHAGAALRELVMEPGACLYLPTGTLHSARSEDTISLHITIGINQLTLRGLVQRTIKTAVDDVPNTHLAAAFNHDPAATTAALAAQLAALADRLHVVDAGSAVEAEVARIATTRPSRVAGGLLDRVALDDIDDETRLRRRPGHPLVLQNADDTEGARLHVLLGDRGIDVPASLRPALEAMAAHSTLTPSDLADHLDPQSRVVLCRRLVREGLLEVVR